MKKKTEQNAAGAPQTGKTAGAGAAGFLKKNWKWLVPVACVAVLGGVWLLKPKADKPASVDTSYVKTAPEQRDLVNALSGTGTLKPANTYNVKSLVSGKVLTCSFEEGDNVEEGDVLYTVDSSDATTKVEQAGITLQQAQRNYDKTVDRQYVRAEVAGVVSSLKVAKGDEVTSGQEVAVIRDNSKMTLALEFPAADAAGFSVGQSADVTLDGTFETLTGTITAVTGTDALSTGNLLTRTVTISVRNAGGLTTAQAATATVNGVSSIGAAAFQYQAERTLTTLAAGTVTAIHAREGDSVNKDDIVLQISGDDLSESIQSASETLRGAELSMQSTQDTMNNYTITSPISGTIIEKNAKVGDALSTGNLLTRTVTLSVSNAGGLTTAQAATATVNGVSSIAAANFQYQAERTLTALTSGTVTAINVREGGNVNKDDIILTLSGEELTESIQSASETLRGAELSMQNMQDTMDNYTITSPISGTIIEKAAKVGDALSTGSDLCTIYDLSYLEMTINVDELQVSSLSVGQTVQVTADAVQDKTYEGVVTRVSMKGDTSGGTTTYPVTVRIDETDGLRPGMNANAEIVVAQAKNALAVPNAAVVRGSYVLVTQDSPSAVNADPDMVAPDGFVYVKVKLGVSDSDYTQVVSGLTAQDTVGYDPSSVSSDTYYDNGGYEYMTDGTTDTTGGETTDGTADGEGAESTVTEEPAVDEPVDAGNDGEVIGEADGVILT